MQRDSVELQQISSRPSSGILNKSYVSIEEGYDVCGPGFGRVPLEDVGAAVVVRGAQKSYKSGHPVLAQLDMTVPCGSIYGLLGSSGCGKTTLLSCIIGARRLNKGEIILFGEIPGTKSLGIPGRNVGYMPQDICLYQEFSIEETLVYFGTLCGMTKEEVKQAMSFLAGLLQLPELSRRIESLSGGQQRRVSFATALIHDPELLILDEPTVGVDPLLQQKIWEHLEALVSRRRTTVILTTHYIEEAKRATNIGLLKNGVLMAEGETQQLILQLGNGNSSLEDIVLNLCKGGTATKKAISMRTRQNRHARTNSEVAPPSHHSRYRAVDVKMAKVLNVPKSTSKDSVVRVRAMVGRNFTVLFRNIVLLTMVIWKAPLDIVMICFSFGNDLTNLPFGLVNDELNYSAICPSIQPVAGECNVKNLSCHFAHYISNETIDLKVYNTGQEAVTATKRGEVWGYLHFPANFSSLLYQRISTGAANVDEEVLLKSIVKAKMDMTNKQIALALRKALYDAYKAFTAFQLTSCGFDKRQGESPLQVGKSVFGDEHTTFREYLAPTSGLGFLVFYAIITSSVRYIREKKTGMLDRSMLLGVKVWEFLLAYSIAEFCMLLAQAVLAVGVFTLLFDIQIKGSIPLTIFLIVLFGYGGVSMGVLIGTVLEDEMQAALFAMASYFPSLCISGVFWPVEGEPGVVQYISKAMITTTPSESLRSIISRGWEITHPHVWLGLVVLSAHIGTYYSLTILYHKFFKK